MRKKSLNPFELRILHFIRQENLSDPGQPVLAAVSGGLDSMVLLSLLLRLDYKPQVLHVNFQLREKESDLDQKLVEDFCLKTEIPFYCRRIQTLDWKRKDLIGQSRQMAARTLRYEWFEKMVHQTGIEKVALAHHADDQAETVLLQVLRGGGMNSLSGMKPANGFYIRPLLEISKSELVQYAKENVVQWRQDQTNLESKYDRNLLRNQVFPVLNEGFGGFQKVLNRNAKRWQSYASGIQFLMESLEKEWMKAKSDSSFTLDLQQIRIHPAGLLFLSDKLMALQFHFDQVEEIWRSGPSSETRLWKNESKNHQVQLRNNELLISLFKKKSISFSEPILIPEPTGFFEFGGMTLHIEKLQKVPADLKSSGKWTMYADLGEIKFPLTLRKAEHGDKIKPLGMNGKSKPVSEIIAEAKLSLAEMENVYVLADQNQIVWVLGMKVSDLIKISTQTKTAIRISIE